MQPLDGFLSKAEQRLLAAVLARPDAEFGTVELLDGMGKSRSAGSNLLNRWVAAGLLRDRHVGNQRRFAANPDFLLYPELRRIVQKTIGLTQPLAAALAPIADRLDDAFVFGSVAAGSDTSESDIDVALVGDVDLFTVSPLVDRAESELGRSIHANVYSAAEWQSPHDPVLQAIKAGARLDLMEALRGQAD